MIEKFKSRHESLGIAMCDAANALEKSTEAEKEKNFRALVAASARFSIYLGDEMETANIDRLIEELQMTKAEHADDTRLTERANVFYTAVREECDWALNALKDVDSMAKE